MYCRSNAAGFCAVFVLNTTIWSIETIAIKVCLKKTTAKLFVVNLYNQARTYTQTKIICISHEVLTFQDNDDTILAYMSDFDK